jgi:hypothetical protein
MLNGCSHHISVSFCRVVVIRDLMAIAPQNITMALQGRLWAVQEHLIT